METVHNSNFKLNVVVKEHGMYLRQSNEYSGDQSFDMCDVLSAGGVPPGEYKITVTMTHDGHEEIGIAVYDITSITKVVFHAAWHNGEFKNFPGGLGDWWGNEIICTLSVENMLVEDIMIPQFPYIMEITVEPDTR
jgi:hypothetical protein